MVGVRTYIQHESTTNKTTTPYGEQELLDCGAKEVIIKL